MYYNFHRVRWAFHGEQLCHNVVALAALAFGMNSDDLARVLPLEKVRTFQQALQLVGMGVLGHNQHEGLDHRHIVVAGVYFQLDFSVLMDAHAIFQLDALKAVC